MRLITRTLAVTTLLLMAIPAAHAQTIDPSGHWEGTISGPLGELAIEIDLMKSPDGRISGTLSEPIKKLRGLPLSAVKAEGGAVSFELALSGGGTLHGSVAADGKAITGEFGSMGGPVSFTLKRTGEARIYAPPRSAAISKELEGVWTGTLEADGGLRVVLKMSNQPDGSSMAILISVDQGGIEIPAAITRKDTMVTLDLAMVGSSYSGTLNAAGTELAGTFTTAQGLSLPLTFQRASK